MAQGSPPSPRTRESMLGSAFAAVKSYFTPERNNSSEFFLIPFFECTNFNNFRGK